MRPAMMALGLLAAGLVAAIGLQVAALWEPEVADLAAPRRPAEPAVPRPRGDEARGVELLARSLARPLFNPDRRPTPESVGAGGAPAPETPRLAGILVTANGRHAIFASGDRSIVVGEGESIGGFRVIGISGEQVSVEGPQGLRILRPSFVPAGAGAAARGGSGAGTEAAFNANPAPSGLDILRNAARQAAAPMPGSALPPPVPGVEQTGVGTSPAPARPQGVPTR